MERFLITIYKIFFIGLLVQFFAQTFVTFGLGFDIPYLWLWKEAVIGVLIVVGIGGIVRHWRRRQIFITPTVGWRKLGLIVTIAATAYIHLHILHLPLNTYLLAFKYDFLGFVILLAGLHSSALISKKGRKHLIQWYGKVIKRTLLLALARYLVIIVKPGTLKLFGYDNFVYEWAVGSAPPAAYYTQINYGLTRNQFLFERPISRGFYLTAFFPLFFMLFFRKQKLKNTRARRAIYAINIILTFSRAARGSWIIEIIVLSIITHRGQVKKFLFKILLPILVLLWVVGYFGYKDIFDRGYSNNGHINMIEQWRTMFAQSPLFGLGGSSAGPASYQEGGAAFNPENQYLQIMIEFGLIGFLWWILLYLLLNFLGLQERHKKHTRGKKITPSLWRLVGMSIGMIGLSVSWMVLHSFTDRMIVYPMMLLFGIVWMSYIKREGK